MKFFSNEIQDDDSHSIRSTSAQSISNQVSFKEKLDSMITICPFKSSTIEEQTGSLTKSKPTTVTTKVGNGQISLLDTTSIKYNTTKDSNKTQVISLKMNNRICITSLIRFRH